MKLSHNLVFADDDGCIFTSGGSVNELLSTARAIWTTERRQAEEIVSGKCLRVQLKVSGKTHGRSRIYLPPTFAKYAGRYRGVETLGWNKWWAEQ